MFQDPDPMDTRSFTSDDENTLNDVSIYFVSVWLWIDQFQSCSRSLTDSVTELVIVTSFLIQFAHSALT